MVEAKDMSVVSQISELSNNKASVISISGASGLGKTTLALQVVGSFLTSETFSRRQCVWVQASEQFPKKRLLSLFKGLPEKVKMLLQNIFVYPAGGPFLEYPNQSEFLRKLRETMLPLDTVFICIDNISHHLRFAASLCSNIKQKGALMDEFFSSQLFPLIMRCLREGITLILIHEVSFDPNSGTTKPFYDKLYSRINSVNIALSKSFKSSEKRIRIASRGQEDVREFLYEIKDRGILIR